MSDAPGPELTARTDAVLAAAPAGPEAAEVVGRSREGRPVTAFRLGRGPVRLSLLAGCHADEPVGPILLRRLAGYLSSLSAVDPLVRELSWWIVPHANPDGEEANRRWSEHRIPTGRGGGGPDAADDHPLDAAGDRPDAAPAFDLARYLAFAVRELPGDDVEFCFPADHPDDADDGARPENRAILRWWRRAEGPFHLHASLHGMATGAGPWFLIEPAWRPRSSLLRRRLAGAAEALGLRLHDVERRGEKGFVRIGRGFSTRPDSHAMKAHFVASGDPETAGRFRPSSMETVRSLGGDPLTMVSEVPLFLTPGVGEELGPPDPAAERWRERIAGWQVALRGHGDRTDPAAALEGDAARRVRREAAEAGLRPVPIETQLRLQWAMIAAGLAQVLSGDDGAAAGAATPR